MASTKEELDRRRAERMANPVYREIVNRAKRQRWAREKDRINAEKRARYAERTPEEVEHERAQRKAYRDKPGAREKANKRKAAYYARHRERIRAKQKAYYERKMTDPSFVARVERNNARYAERCRTDPAVKAARAAATRKWKKSAKGRAVMERRRIMFWEQVADGGRLRIAQYMRHTTPGNRHAFVVWYHRRHLLIDRTKGLGHIDTPSDEPV